MGRWARPRYNVESFAAKDGCTVPHRLPHSLGKGELVTSTLDIGTNYSVAGSVRHR